MKPISYTHAYPMGQDTDSRTMALYFGISMLIHVVFIGSVIFMPTAAAEKRNKREISAICRKYWLWNCYGIGRCKLSSLLLPVL